MNEYAYVGGHARTFAKAFVILLLTTMALHWGWNAFAAEVLALPAIHFRQALALELLLIVVGAVPPLAWRLCAGRASTKGLGA